MTVLVAVTNNLQYDSRVKRHSLFLSEFFDRVDIVCLPLHDGTKHLEQGGITQTFVENAFKTRRGGNKLLERARRLGVGREVLTAFPFAGLDTMTPPKAFLELGVSLQESMLSAKSFRDVRGALCCDSNPGYDVFALRQLLNLWLNIAEFGAERPADVVLCNDLETLMLGIAHKRRYGSRLVYDAHEIYFDMAPHSHSRMHKSTMALLESELIQHADFVMGVSPGQVEWMKWMYAFSAPCAAVPNCSQYVPAVPLAPKQLDEANIRLYYHGASDPYRGIEELLCALKALPANYTAVLKCMPSEHLPVLKQMAQEPGLAGRVVWKEPVGAEQIIESCHQDGDIAFATPTASVKNCMGGVFALTNKFIEYTKAGVPVIGSTLDVQNDIIERYGAGAVIPDNTVEAILQGIETITQTKEGYTQMSAGALRAAQEVFSWEACSAQLREVFGVGA